MTDAGDLSLVFTRALGKVIIQIHGSLDARTAHELEDRLVDIIDGQGNRRLVLDLGAMTSIDSTGFFVLVDALTRMQNNGGELVLSGPTRRITRAFEAAGLDKVFVITPAWAHPARGDGHSVLGLPTRRGYGGEQADRRG